VNEEIANFSVPKVRTTPKTNRNEIVLDAPQLNLSPSKISEESNFETRTPRKPTTPKNNQTSMNITPLKLQTKFLTTNINLTPVSNKTTPINFTTPKQTNLNIQFTPLKTNMNENNTINNLVSTPKSNKKINPLIVLTPLRSPVSKLVTPKKTKEIGVFLFYYFHFY
jgi:hypothetical protein